MSGVILERDALYYPYVHFPSEAWLKSALLFSPHVYRMVASKYQPRWDTDFMRQIRKVQTQGVHLLEHAELWSETALKAQKILLGRLCADIELEGEAFKQRFGKAAARAIAKDDQGFQMHPGKLTGGLIYDLERLGLAWTPDHPDDREYWELHPAIGGAFLGAIAVACAADRGLAVVGDAEDATCKKLNQFAASGEFEVLYNDFVHGTKSTRKPLTGTGEAVADVILFNHCDASAITVEDLQDLAKEREPIRKLKAKLQELAAQIPPMLDEEHFQQKVQQCAVEALDEWKKDRPSFRGALKKFFGADLVKSTTELVKGSIGKAVDFRSGVSDAGAAVSAGGAAFHFLGPIAGFGVGLAVHAVSTAISEVTRERQSSYRYLSMAEKAGVVFSIGGTRSAKNTN